MNLKYKVLHLVNTAADAKPAAAELKKSKIEFEHLFVDNKEEFSNALEQLSPDIVLCNHPLTSFNCSKVQDVIEAKKLPIPCILVANEISEEDAKDFIEGGADHHIYKDKLTRLPGTIEKIIEEWRQKKSEQGIDELANKKSISKEAL
ncbi:MAG: hypothetical protein JWQ40_3617 [Segetibacter sp.]|jgi:DNA-binding NarL/FixJ family response regulator|nr:hypothetical protein [Segetibacter sp.]